MRFEFSFQKILDVKEKEKEQAREEFGTVKRRQTELQDKMVQLHQLKGRYLAQFNDANQKKVLEMRQIQEHVDHLDRQIHDLTTQYNLLNQEVDNKQQMLIDKSKEEKIWQHWKTKSLEAFKKQMEQQEQATLDEMAVLRYSRP